MLLRGTIEDRGESTNRLFDQTVCVSGEGEWAIGHPPLTRPFAGVLSRGSRGMVMGSIIKQHYPMTCMYCFLVFALKSRPTMQKGSRTQDGELS